MLKSHCILVLNLFVFDRFRNELALQQMGTIFLVDFLIVVNTVHIYVYHKCLSSMSTYIEMLGKDDLILAL